MIHIQTYLCIVKQDILNISWQNDKDKKSHFKAVQNPADQHLIPYNITPESHFRVMRIKEMITNCRFFWLLNKFSLSAHKKCIENRMENMHTDVRV